MKAPSSRIRARENNLLSLTLSSKGGEGENVVEWLPYPGVSLTRPPANVCQPSGLDRLGLPKAPTLLILLCSLSLLPVQAGTITGIVKAQGKEGADDPACGGKYASRQFKFAERVNYEEMHDFIVYIEGKVGTNFAAPDKPVQVVTARPSSVLQKRAMFEPHVLPVMMGTRVEWPNHDEIYHNVFSFSEGNAFDLGLYKKDDPMKSMTFTNAGRVDVFCSIHSRMSCIVLVLENPFFAATDQKGKYQIQNVPPGTYKLKAWHERVPSLAKEITVTGNGETKVDFTLGIMNLPKP